MQIKIKKKKFPPLLGKNKINWEDPEQASGLLYISEKKKKKRQYLLNACTLSSPTFVRLFNKILKINIKKKNE